MSDFAQMHIFFLVTTVAVVVVALLFSLAFFYVVRILRNVNKISEEALAEVDLARADIATLRANIKEEGFKAKNIASFIRQRAERFFGMKKGKKD